MIDVAPMARIFFTADSSPEVRGKPGIDEFGKIFPSGVSLLKNMRWHPGILRRIKTSAGASDYFVQGAEKREGFLRRDWQSPEPR